MSYPGCELNEHGFWVRSGGRLKLVVEPPIKETAKASLKALAAMGVVKRHPFDRKLLDVKLLSGRVLCWRKVDREWHLIKTIEPQG